MNHNKKDTKYNKPVPYKMKAQQTKEMKHNCMQTCKSMDALAQSTTFLKEGKPFVKLRFKPIILLGDE